MQDVTATHPGRSRGGCRIRCPFPVSRNPAIGQVAEHAPIMITAQSAIAFGVHDEFQHSVKDPNSILGVGRMGLPLSGIQLGHPTG